MGLAIVVFWVAIILFLVPFVYTAIVRFREKTIRDSKLREIQRKLSERQDTED